MQLRLMRETLQTAEEPTAPSSVTLSRRLLQDNIEDEQVAAASTATSPSGVQAMPGVGVCDTAPGQVTAAAAAGTPAVISTQHVLQSKPRGCPGMVAVNKGNNGKWKLERRTERSCTPAGQLEDDQRLAQLAAEEKLLSSWCVLSVDETGNNNLAGKD